MIVADTNVVSEMMRRDADLAVLNWFAFDVSAAQHCTSSALASSWSTHGSSSRASNELASGSRLQSGRVPSAGPSLGPHATRVQEASATTTVNI